MVIACLPAATAGKVSAATVAKDMIRCFPAVRFGLMLGIGGGAPYFGAQRNSNSRGVHAEDEYSDNSENDTEDIRDVRLGDVVISLHSKSSDAVRLLELVSEHPGNATKFQYPGSRKDCLFKSTIIHTEGKRSCKNCRGPQDSNLVRRKDRPDSPRLHYGTIGSADQVMKDTILRDRWTREESILCFEMEAAGLMDSFPCLVIRGICDYADSHTNKIWQPYSAATAASYARELLLVVSGRGS
ncbi:nucleoside phosphorylase domain-containing protein [Aspergillus arachidicola]|uniref:Nucleoside phosphorylase domain-containing protein n=1 Tax=Aspergillus arachidicola TaxID=656916 RepID=A0A5N6XLZ9_9EURO|nr:nucleoside phosphorylase domain-containing protein [Aspergillus arachidicola]